MVQWVWRAVVAIALLGLVASNCLNAARAQGDEVASLRAQVSQLYDQGKYEAAAAIAERYVALARQKYGDNHTEYATAIAWLAYVYQAQARYPEAEPLYKRALGIDEQNYGSGHPAVATDLNDLALLYRSQGRYSEAEPLYKRSLVIREKALGPEHPDVGTSLNNLATLYRIQGRYAEAEPLYKRSIAIDEKSQGPEHPDLATDLSNLASLYEAEGRYGEAEPLYKRSLAIYEKTLGFENPEAATDLNNLAELYREQGRYPEAEPLYKRSLAIREKTLGPGHPDVSISLNNLALLFFAQGRYDEAERLYKRSLAIRENGFGPDHPAVGRALNNLGMLYVTQGRFGEAEPLLERSLAIREKALGSDNPDVGTSLNSLASLYFVQRDWPRAAGFWRRSTGIIVRRARRGMLAAGQPLVGSRMSEASQLASEFFGLVKSVYRLATEDRSSSQEQAAEMFESAQWAYASEAANSVAQMAARSAKGDPRLAAIVRERQDLVTEWQKRDFIHTAAVSQPPDKRNHASEVANTNRLAAIDTRIAAIDELIKADFPDYAALASVTPLSVGDVQAQLHPHEALVLFLDTPEWGATPEESFIWVITKTEMRWVRSELGTPALQREGAALRCGLDAALWQDGEEIRRCRGLVKGEPQRDAFGNIRSETLPFDRNRAFALYRALFGQIEDLIKDKNLLILPSGALSQLPFQVLITAEPDATASREDVFRRVAWLARSRALTVLPSVSSLKALRQVAKDSHADRAMIGFGNPLLDGDQNDPRDGQYYKNLASQARAKRSCPATPEPRAAALTRERRGVRPLALRSGLADTVEIRMQSPLPETADELCAVARDLHVGENEIHLGARATETEIKRLSKAGELAKYRIIHFATHGTLAGQVGGNSEPGLLLTPPKNATEEDDGYLSASEIAALKLDADWVILSACNTAAGGAEGAEALSGLARAFFYAGARALLVSHWAVNSDATVKLITGAVSRMAADKSVGRAEAMRQSMLALIDTGAANEAHPAFWAPFIVVGEGAAAK